MDVFDDITDFVTDQLDELVSDRAAGFVNYLRKMAAATETTIDDEAVDLIEGLLEDLDLIEVEEVDEDEVDEEAEEE